ncbi:MAG: hypothetical protein RLZZ584_1426 [Pseudomonadota bacterium]|jgi:hypothetical protein
MEMLYNSDNFAVVHFEFEPDHVQPEPELQLALAVTDPARQRLTRAGYEIVDKAARREIYLDGAMAENFKRGVQDLISGAPDEDDVDNFLAGYTVLAHQPVVLH